MTQSERVATEDVAQAWRREDESIGRADPDRREQEIRSLLPTHIRFLRCHDCDIEVASPAVVWPAGAYPRDQSYPVRWEFHRALRDLGGRPAEILELGCGTGEFLAMAEAHGHRATGIDFNEDAVAKARARGLRAYAGGLDDLACLVGADRRFDAVVFFHVIEHLSDPGALLDDLARWCKPGARLSISCPGPRRFTRLIREQQVVDRDYWDYPPQHVLRWTRPALSALLTRHGWQTEHIVEEPFSWVAAVSQIAVVRGTYRGEIQHAVKRRLNLITAWLRLLTASEEFRHGVSLYVTAPKYQRSATVSRTRKAAITASFVYLQFAFAMVNGLVLVPFVLRHLGARTYGLWMASGEVLAYAALVDLGVLGVLPWMLAELDGRHDRGAMRALLVNATSVGLVISVAYTLVALVLWFVLPSALQLTAADSAALGPPLLMLAAAAVVGYPLRVFAAVVAGVQDALFNGLLGVAQSTANLVITLVMLSQGHGVYALATASAASSLLVVVASLARAAVIAPDLLRGWPRPTWAGVRLLFVNGTGAWLGSCGWQILAASNSVVITWLGHPEWVPIYLCTAKLASLSTQLAWVLPDSGLIGLAQLHGEGPHSTRVRQVVVAMLRLYLLIAGGAACVLLALNSSFVVWWVGPSFFGGLLLSSALAGGVIVQSLAHGLLAAASVLGNRLRAGVVGLAHAALQVGCAVLAGHFWGLPGIAFTALAVAACVAIPAGVRLLAPATGLRFNEFVVEVIGSWFARAVPLLAVAGAAGVIVSAGGIWKAGVAGVALSFAYIWQMRPLYERLPVDARCSRWLVSLRLMSALPRQVSAMEQP